MKDIIMDTLIDALKLLPFLFIAFLLIELIEHKFNKKIQKLITKDNKFGPIVGALLGLFPQCGFSVLATNLYVTRVITLGTLISIYLSTSDEMLPMLLAENTSGTEILKLLSIKFIIGLISGIIIDFIVHKNKKEKNIDYHICDDEHCHCEKGIFVSALLHTIKTLIFIMLVSFILNISFEFLGEKYLSHLFLKDSLFGPFISSLVGLIPNCGASVMITELYLNNAINLSSCIAGLLTGSGVALIVLFKSNKNLKENLTILALVYFIGAVSGLIIEIITRLI